MSALDVAATVAAAFSWPGVEAGYSGDAVLLAADGRAFASVSADGVELTLPPRVRDMLVETGRATPLPSAGQAFVAPDGDGGIDLALLRLAHERARVTTAYQARQQPR